MWFLISAFTEYYKSSDMFYKYHVNLLYNCELVIAILP